MKLLLIALTLIVHSFASANPGNCVSRPGSEAHENFCKQQTLQTCGIHSAMCTWEKSDVKRVKIIDGDSTRQITIIEEKVHQCSAKPGNEVHEGFCAKHNKQICATHSHICEWN